MVRRTAKYVVYLDAVLVDIDIVSSGTVTCLTKDDKLLEEKYVPQTSLASVTDNKLRLT